MITGKNKESNHICPKANMLTHFKKKGILSFLDWNIKTRDQNFNTSKSSISYDNDSTLSSFEIEAMMAIDTNPNLYKRAVLRTQTSYEEYKKEVFKFCSNLIKVSYTEINDKYMIYFLTESKLKILYCIDETTMVKDIQSEVEKMFYKSYHIYSENIISQRETFMKSSRDVLITQASFLLSYLRQGLINLKDVNYLIFEPKKLLFGEENCMETILKEFYIPLMNLGSVNLPKIFIIDTSTDDNKINNGLRSSTLEDAGLRNTELILAICKHTYQIFCEKKEEKTGVIAYKVMKDSRIFQTLSLMMQDIIISQNQKIFDTNCFSILHKHQSHIYEQIPGYSFFYNPNYLEFENVRNMGSIVLDLFQLSLMDKRNLQSQMYISRIMYNVLFVITQSSDYATKLYMITEKMKTINGNISNININDILIIFADKKGNLNLFSKLLKILDLISIKEDVSGSGDSELTKKLFLPIHVQFMLIIYTYVFINLA